MQLHTNGYLRLLQPSASIHVSKKGPNRLIKRAAKIIRTGYGQPSIFNTDAVIQEMVTFGKSLQDARNGGTSGCVETGAFGKENYSLTGYLNIPKILEITLHNGRDPRNGKQIGLQTGAAQDFERFDDLFAAFVKQLKHFIEIKVNGNQVIERLYERVLPAPFLSLLIDDCISTGLDYHEGGARYNTTCHVYFGSVMGASADGRLAGKPLSEGISPVQGADRKGPTAVLKSAAKMDHLRTGGTLLNQKFTPSLLRDEQGLNALVQLVRSYFNLDGHHIQFNVVDADMLKAAQLNPAEHRDLIVCVAGYSDYFCDLSQVLQEEIIARTGHDEF